MSDNYVQAQKGATIASVQRANDEAWSEGKDEYQAPKAKPQRPNPTVPTVLGAITLTQRARL